MVRKSIAVGTLVILIISLFIVNLDHVNEMNGEVDIDISIDRSTIINTRSEGSRNSQRSLIETNSHGGSWLDSFEDQTGIDWGNSDNINTSDNETKMIRGTPKPLDVDSNTLALWHFDEGAGPTANDESPYNNDGSVNGPSWTNGIFDQALDYNGGSDHVAVSDHPSLEFDPGEPITFEFWVKTTATWNNIIIKYQEGITGNFQFYTWHDGSVVFNILCVNKNRPGIWGPVITDNKWHYIAGVRDINMDQLLLYIDGELVKYCEDTTTGKIDTPGPLKIGKYVGGSALPFNGKIDEVRISNRSLSAFEIADNYGPYSRTANLTSQPISLPIGMQWDTISLLKEEPENCWLNISVLNATTNLPIAGFANLQPSNIDLSTLDPVQYPRIKLNATFEGNSIASPKLHYWGVSWVAVNAWKDTFFSDLKVDSKFNLVALDGRAKISKLVPDEHTIGLWHFDEGAGTVAYDDTKYGNNGILGGTGTGSNLPAWTTGKFGYAHSYDGINDIVAAPDRLSVSITGNISIEAWLKFSALPSANQAFPIVKKRALSSDSYELCIQDDGKPRLLIDTGPAGGNYIDGNTVVNDNKWHYIAATWDQTALNLYIDGISDAAPVAHTGIMNNTLDFLYFGYHPGDSATDYDYYNGLMDCIRISNIARSPQEINNIYENLSGPGISFTDANLISEPIPIPYNSYWETLLINKTEQTQTYLNVTVVDAFSNQPIQPYVDLNRTGINLSSIDPHLHTAIRLQASFVGDSTNTSILHDWSVNWRPNMPPKVVELIPTSNFVYRTNTTQLYINATDFEDLQKDIEVEISYRSPLDADWKTDYLSDLNFENNMWVMNFTPTKNAILGQYSFNVSCNDTFQEFDNKKFYDVITVLNSPPTQPDLIITPAMPRTLDDLNALVSNATDAEDESITYYYEWYKDDILQHGLNSNYVTSGYTAQNEVWKCIVTPNDGNDNGTSNEAEVSIQNTPPEINHSLLSVTFLEDNIDHSLNLSYTFKDPDFDALIFEVEGDDKLDVNIFENGTVELIPEPNWFGIEILTFYANDNLAEINDSVVVKVLPTNDEPVLTEIIGPKKTYLPSLLIEIKTDEDEWLNLTVNAYDIDGDDLTYSTNRTDKIGLDDLSNLFIESNIISYLPTNDDVGVLTLNVTVSDNNGSEIYQNLEIEIQNTNDPPTVKITYPTDGSAFETTDTINFSCEWSDVDFDVPEPTEHLTFTWYTNHSTSKLGQGEILTNKTLVAGFHTITLEVEDYDGEIAVDSINITVTDPPPPPDVETQSTTKTENLWWLILIVIVVIIVILIILFGVLKRKKQAKEAEKAAAESDALIPEIVGKPGAEPLPATPTVPIPRQLTPSVTPTPVVQVQAPPPAPALAGVQPTIRPSLPPAQVEEKKELSKDEKLKLLEERLIKGDIDQELYEELKQKLLTEEEPSVTETPPTPTEVTEPAPTPVPKLKTPVMPKVVTPDIKSEEEPPDVEEAPSQLDEQPVPQEELAEELESESTGVVCPQCQSDAIATYPDGSSSCSYCGNKWL